MLDRSNNILSNEQINIIEALKKVDKPEIVLLTPNSSTKLSKDKYIVVSIIESSADTIKGVNGDNGKLGMKYDMSIGIKSVGKEPLKDIAETQKLCTEQLGLIGYKEVTSNSAFDEIGIPVLFLYMRRRQYNK